MALINKYGDTDFISGMRAWAALGVVLIHSGGAGLRSFANIGNSLADMGASGVYVFFVISGYTVALSYEQSHGFKEYFFKRFFRLAPLYYFYLIIFPLIAWLFYNVDYYSITTKFDLYNFLMHLSFLSFLDYRITNSILGVEWSLSIEFFWYLILPVVLKIVSDPKRAVIFILASFVFYQNISILYRFISFIPQEDLGLAFAWSPVAYIFSYACGVAVYRIRPLIQQTNKKSDIIIIFAIMMILTKALLDIPVLDNYLLFSIISTMLILGCKNESILCKFLFSNRYAVFIGLISYGIYLSHACINFAVIKTSFFNQFQGLYRFIIISCSAIIISILTYYLIEIPGQKFCKKNNL